MQKKKLNDREHDKKEVVSAFRGEKKKLVRIIWETQTREKWKEPSVSISFITKKKKLYDTENGKTEVETALHARIEELEAKLLERDTE